MRFQNEANRAREEIEAFTEEKQNELESLLVFKLDQLNEIVNDFSAR